MREATSKHRLQEDRSSMPLHPHLPSHNDIVGLPLMVSENTAALALCRVMDEVIGRHLKLAFRQACKASPDVVILLQGSGMTASQISRCTGIPFIERRPDMSWEVAFPAPRLALLDTRGFRSRPGSGPLKDAQARLVQDTFDQLSQAGTQIVFVDDDSRSLQSLGLHCTVAEYRMGHAMDVLLDLAKTLERQEGGLSLTDCVLRAFPNEQSYPLWRNVLALSNVLARQVLEGEQDVSEDLAALGRRQGKAREEGVTPEAGERPPSREADVPRLADVPGLHPQVRDHLTRLARRLTPGVSKKAPGTLLVGPPGTGKSFLAKVLAKESGRKVFLTSMATLQSGSPHLGSSIERIRNLFAEAKAEAPSLIFLDELDSVGCRSAHAQTSHFWAVVINCILECIDGANGRGDVALLAATNHEQAIDPALLRKGRIGERIEILNPNHEGRLEILKWYLAQQGMSLPDTDLRTFSMSLGSCGPADLEALMGKAIEEHGSGLSLAGLSACASEFSGCERKPTLARAIAQAARFLAVTHHTEGRLVPTFVSAVPPIVRGSQEDILAGTSAYLPDRPFGPTGFLLMRSEMAAAAALQYMEVQPGVDVLFRTGDQMRRLALEFLEQSGVAPGFMLSLDGRNGRPTAVAAAQATMDQSWREVRKWVAEDSQRIFRMAKLLLGHPAGLDGETALAELQAEEAAPLLN